jgi:hypothetical protein
MNRRDTSTDDFIVVICGNYRTELLKYCAEMITTAAIEIAEIMIAVAIIK